MLLAQYQYDTRLFQRMDDLNDILIGNVNDSSEVETNMLDYEFVATCEDLSLLKKIYKKLLKGREGRYPHLEETVKNKILGLLPVKEKRKVLALTSIISSEEVRKESNSLNEWLEAIHNSSNMVDGSTSDDTHAFTKHLPLRGSQTQTRDIQRRPTKSTLKEDLDVNRQQEERISKEKFSNRDYFRAWDKFDVEAAEKALEDNQDDTNRYRHEDQDSKDKKRREMTAKNLQSLREKLKCNLMSESEKIFLAKKEKEKGNDYFRSGDYEEAFSSYSKSLALNEKDAVAYANRAMTSIKLSKLSQACADCSMALEIDPKYHKARARRGTVHHKCGRYLAAIEDFSISLKLDPKNADYHKLLSESRAKENELNPKSKKIEIIESDESEIVQHESSSSILVTSSTAFRIPIAEDSSCDEDSLSDMEEVFTPGCRQYSSNERGDEA